ncbi:MAG: copper amine oxidase N-terminal domain-containing protein [Bacillota bacterium]
MKELRAWFLLWLTAMVVLVALPAEGRPSGPLFAGACVDGRPQLARWDPSLDAEFEPVCLEGELTLRAAGGPDRTAEPLAEPADFTAWAFVRLNGRRLRNPYHDAYPYVAASTGKALLPLRLVTEAMGGEVEWEEGERAVRLTWRGRTARLTIGSAEAELNGSPLLLEEAPVLWLDRTMVAPEVIAQLFGARVTWEPETNQVQIRRAGILCSDAYCIKST